ncbi:MAG: hypothetical protein SGJ05_11465 [bacterium]|nr:hypothetical protein [bacterium]
MNNTTWAIATLVIVVICSGCNNSTPETQDQSAISGNATVMCDVQVVEMIRTSAAGFSVDYPKATVSFSPMPGRDAIRELLAGRTDGIIVARNYLADEDSVIKGSGLTYPRTLLAKDALVFYASKSFPYDTMSSVHIKSWFSGAIAEKEMKTLYPKLKGVPPVFVVPMPSSIYSNIVNILGAPPLKGRLTALPSRDSIQKRMLNGSNGLIGLGYLSQFAKDSSVKMLRLSYNDSTGTYQPPKVVHAANLIQGMYPFPVPIYFVLKNTPSQHSLSSGMMQYLSRDAKAQAVFFNTGIEPGYAKIELILPE